MEQTSIANGDQAIARKILQHVQVCTDTEGLRALAGWNLNRTENEIFRELQYRGCLEFHSVKGWVITAKGREALIRGRA